MKQRAVVPQLLLHHDMLCHTFSFLDYSHVPTLSCVCKEWEQIANSNQLWEFYFHLLSNNKKGRTQISSKTLSDDELFWKCKIKNQFSKYSCRVSKSMATQALSTTTTTTGGNELEFSTLKQTFPDALSSQLVKMILSRMYLDSVVCGQDFKSPFVKFHIGEPTSYEPYHFKLQLRIGGISEPLIFRWNRYTCTLGLFGYDYAESYYLYFAKESDDKLNEEDFKSLHTYNRKQFFDKLDDRKACYLYQFIGKNKTGRVCGEEYLAKEILLALVPTLREYELSPKQFVPFWCLLLALISGQFDEYGSSYCSKEFFKHYPNLALNRLCFHHLRKTCLHEVKELNKKICTKLELVEKNKANHERVFTSLNLSIPIPKLATYNATHDLHYLVLHASKYLGPLQSGQKVHNMKRMYKLLVKNLEEMADLYLAYKFKRSYQIVTQ